MNRNYWYFYKSISGRSFAPVFTRLVYNCGETFIQVFDQVYNKRERNSLPKLPFFVKRIHHDERI